ncbi:hypothetical protein BJF92_04620 [Rhizobium rhizosphaerae]|uniref:GSCFA domain-containing protein n=2 Tax=Xaviernesmea rhizosphaerae TaxID=1672749 RepID=A0A1Q9AFX2_9HYPH|nr:hypothetical protein BJF92_04620 [Xaviernesmea rhizosphaerae]
MVNTYAILQQFSWAWEGVAPQADVWHGKKAEDFAHDELVRLETKELFDNADLFIITLGLSELWYDKPTGEVFWRAVPADVYDSQRHCFRTASHAETLHNLHRIYELIRRYRPAARILFSVSPIPLTATFRPISCITADAVSKATLRSALDEFLQAHGEADGVYYFPSYEAVKRIFHYQWGEDRRHVRRDVLDFNMKLFEHYYCSPGIGADEVRAAYDHAWELDHNRAENQRQHDVVSYEERRAITKQAKINARIEARRVEREKVLSERREQQLRQAQLHRRAKSWLQKAVKTKSGVYVQYAAQTAVALLALDGLTDWMDWIPLVFE